MSLKAVAKTSLRKSRTQKASVAAIRFGKHVRRSKTMAEKAASANAPLVDEIRTLKRQL